MEGEGAQLMQKLFPPAVLFRWFTIGVVVAVTLAGGIRLSPWFSFCCLAVAALATWRVPVIRRQAVFCVGILVLLIRSSFLPPALPEQVLLGAQEFSAKVVEPPRIAEKVLRYVVEPQGFSGTRVLLVAHSFPFFSFGDVLRVSCQDVIKEEFSGYLRQGIVRECAFPEISLVSPASSSVRGVLLKLRASAGSRLKQTVSEPYATLATGMLWGDDSGLPRELTDSFNRTGTSHLLAVSGYNVMVLSEMLFWILIGFGLWRTSAAMVMFAILPAFVVFSGGEPAVMRAAVMAALLLLGKLTSRLADRPNLLLGTAAGMLLFSPHLIISLGFQLSFAAMVGISFVAPGLANRLRFIPEQFGLREATAQTLAATIMTLPVVLLGVGKISLVSPFANLLLAPVIPLVYIFGVSALVFGSMHVSIFISLAAWVLSALLFYVTKVTTILATVPWAQVQLKAWWLVVPVLVLTGVAVIFWRKHLRIFRSV